MAQMPQDVNPAAQQGAPGPAQPPQQGGGAKELLMGAHDAMSKLADAMSQSGQVDDDDIKMAQDIVGQIEALADSLSGSKGEQPGGPVPEQAGARPVKPAM